MIGTLAVERQVSLLLEPAPTSSLVPGFTMLYPCHALAKRRTTVSLYGFFGKTYEVGV